MISRRGALQLLGAAALTPALSPALIGLSRKGHVIAGGFVDDDAVAGHALRDGGSVLAANRERRRVQVAIVGGGIGGLSSGWRLDAMGHTDWVLLELGANTGGNALSAVYPGLDGQRAPWGAHYLPIPAPDAEYVRQLCRELGLLHADGTWDERMLCHSPQERLWQHGRWHEGLDPRDAATPDTRAQFARFEARIAEWRDTGLFTVPSAMGHAARARAHARGGSSTRRAYRWKPMP